MPVALLGFSIFSSALSRLFFAPPKHCAKPTRLNPAVHHKTDLRLPLSCPDFLARPKTADSFVPLHAPSHQSETAIWTNPKRLKHA
jgi:hypothetical protein